MTDDNDYYEEIYFDPDTNMSYPLFITSKMSKRMETDVFFAEKLFQEAKNNYTNRSHDEPHSQPSTAEPTFQIERMLLGQAKTDDSSQKVRQDLCASVDTDLDQPENDDCEYTVGCSTTKDKQKNITPEQLNFNKHQEMPGVPSTGEEMLLKNRGAKSVWTYQGTMQLINSYATHIDSGKTILQKFEIIANELGAAKYEVTGNECQRK